MKHRPWLGHAFVVAGLSAMLWLAIAQITRNVVDLDLWHELAFAREIVRLGYVPQGDLFAFTPTVYPSVNHEWGAGMIAYAVLNVAGGSGIMVLNALLAIVALFLALERARQSGLKPALVAIVSVIMLPLLAKGFQPVRAQAYSFVFFSVLLLMLDRDRFGSRRWIALWLPLFVLWVNIHASFVLAFVVVGVCTVDALLERRRNLHLWALLVAMSILALVDPYGAAMYSHLFRTLGMPRPLVTEWASVLRADDASALVPAMAISLAVFTYSVLRGKPERYGIALILVTAVAGCMHAKMLPYFVIAWLFFVPLWLSETPFAAEIVATLMAQRRISLVLWGALLVCSAAVLVVMRFWQPRVPDSGGPISYAVGPVQYLRSQRFSGNVMTDFNHGAYVAWKLYPSVKISMDSRYDVAYPEALVYENEDAFRSDSDCRAFAAKYGADAVIVERSRPLDREMTAFGRWPRVYRDRRFSIYARPGVALPRVEMPHRDFAGTLP